MGLPLSAKDPSPKIQVRGDLRVRFESDWDSRRADGSTQPERDRLRLRARAGLQFHPSPGLEVGLRLRTGSFYSQQSPHITLWDFEGNPTGDKHVLLDQYYLKWQQEKTWFWLGRNQWPLWKANELAWDDDVTPAGFAVGRNLDTRSGLLSLQGAFFATPDGALKFHSVMGAGQAVYTRTFGAWEMTSAGSLMHLLGKPGAEYLHNGNGGRDYTVLTGNLYFACQKWKTPVRLGVDLHQNLQAYSDADTDAIGAAHRDQRTGIAASFQVGSLKNRGDWLASYTFGRIELLALNASYAQDDWTRRGSATQTDASDFQGHEIQGAYVLNTRINVVARFFVVDSITDQGEGKRFRVDLNYRFP